MLNGRTPLTPPVRSADQARQKGVAESYRVAGTTDEVTDCGVCGRQDLTSTVVLTAPDGQALYAGTDCASQLAGRPVTLTEARRIDRSRRDSQRAALTEQRSQENEAERAAVQRFVQDHPEHAGASYYRQMVAWRSAQDRAGLHGHIRASRDSNEETQDG